MKHTKWGGNFDLPGAPAVAVLIPETDDDRTQLLVHLHDAGISHRLSFTDAGTSLRLDLPDNPEWTSSGAATLAVTDANETVPAYFWVVEIEETPPRCFAWWSKQDSQETATNWN